jgi:hypothetical protein
MTPLSSSPCFVLGIPRSGTTWLANILDASPDTTMMLEPFSTIASDTFRPIPPTCLFLDEGSNEFEAYLRGEFVRKLFRNKTLFPASSNSVRRFKLERIVYQLFRRLGRITRTGVSQKHKVFGLLNLNRLERDAQLFPKNTSGTHWIVKELRAAGKVSVLKEAFPDAKFVILIRHPAATVDSILRWFGKGRLGELQDELVSFNSALKSQVIGRKYAGLLEKVESSGHKASQLALYWRVHYETLISVLANEKAAKIVTMEELACRPQETVNKIFSHFELDVTPSVGAYLEHSTQKSGSDSPLSTTRISETHYRKWQTEIDDSTRLSVESVVEGSVLMSHFVPYYS